MLVTLLGTGAPLMPDRAATGMVVTAPGCEPLLIDTCGGLELARQLALVGMPIASIRNVIVTHRHQDHAGGMLALSLARQPLEIYAHADTLAGIAAMKAACFPEWQEIDSIRRHQVVAGETRDIGGFEVTFVDATHRVPTLAVRVRSGQRVFAFSADTLPSDAIVGAARSCDLFLCDAICAEADGEAARTRARDLMHPSAREAALMATRAGAGQLVLTHIGRFGSPELIQAEAKDHFTGRVSIARDGERLNVAA
jgi:ribonuclease BN (tRNA processing enzyme)